MTENDKKIIATDRKQALEWLAEIGHEVPSEIELWIARMALKQLNLCQQEQRNLRQKLHNQISETKRLIAMLKTNPDWTESALRVFDGMDNSSTIISWIDDNYTLLPKSKKAICEICGGEGWIYQLDGKVRKCTHC